MPLTGAGSDVQLFAVSVLAVLLGLAILTDWNGCGTWWYELQDRANLPGAGWYRKHGGRRGFCVSNGLTAIGCGIFLALVTLLHVTN